MQLNFLYRARFLTCLFFLSSMVSAKLIKDEVSIIDEKFFSYQQVCKELTKRDSPLITANSVSKLDCMGTVVDVGKFCDKKTQADPYYIRAVVLKESKQVVCKSAKRVQIKYECASKHDKLCEDKEIGCYLLQEQLAKRLKTAHASIIKNGKKRYLNCHYTPKVDELKLKPSQM